MLISSVDVQPLNLSLQTALTVAYGSYPVLEYALVKIITADGQVGLGEASPDPEVTGETQAAVLGALQKIGAWLEGRDPAEIAPILDFCLETIPEAPAAIAAIDMALHDLLGKALGVPVYTFLGGKAQPAAQLYPVIPLDTPAVMAATSQRFMALGSEVLKVKLGTAPSDDMARLQAIVDACGSQVRLRLDINQGWRDAATTIETIRQLNDFNIEWIEQPVLAHDLPGLAAVRAAVDLPIMADEACLSPADAMQIARLGAADLINIKLMKCGGLRQAAKILAIAEAAGIRCILGSMGESSIGSAAGLHFVAANAAILACELIGPLFIQNDPAGGFLVDPSTFQAFPSEAPGLGVWLK